MPANGEVFSLAKDKNWAPFHHGLTDATTSIDGRQLREGTFHSIRPGAMHFDDLEI
jgi:hypothetical protein